MKRHSRTLTDRGAAGIEYAGATLLVAAFFAAAVVAAALTTPSVIGEGVSASICRAFERINVSTGGCADLGAYDEASPPSGGTPVEEVWPELGDSYGPGEGSGTYEPLPPYWISGEGSGTYTAPGDSYRSGEGSGGYPGSAGFGSGEGMSTMGAAGEGAMGNFMPLPTEPWPFPPYRPVPPIVWPGPPYHPWPQPPIYRPRPPIVWPGPPYHPWPLPPRPPIFEWPRPTPIQPPIVRPVEPIFVPFTDWDQNELPRDPGLQ